MEKALSDRVVAYDEDFTVALHAPYADTIGDGSMDLYRRHYSGRKSRQRTFPRPRSRWAAAAILNPVIREEIRRKHIASGIVRGAVTGSDGHAIERPVVVIEKEGKPYGWVLGNSGRYEIRLPAGEFTLYGTAQNYSQSLPAAVRIGPNAIRNLDIGGLKSPGRVRFNVSEAGSGAPLDRQRLDCRRSGAGGRISRAP